jgi:superfamily II DNA/RNA helicase/adenylate kinase family enzyme
MNTTLKKWIAQSESWQASIDLHIPQEEQAHYHFLPRYDDFYISLMNSCIDVLISPNRTINKEEALLIAKGMEIFSLKDKRENFKYVDKQNNMLYAASLYYLTDYTASAIILASLYSNYNSPIDSFVSNILRKSLRQENEFTKILKTYFETGELKILDELLSKIDDINQESFDSDIDLYLSSLLAKRLIEKIKDDNIWTDLLRINHDKEHWKPYILYCIKKERAIINFFPSQRSALKGGILSEKTISLQMPTSSGKTFLSEIVIYNQIRKYPDSKILYLTPFRALASELKRSLAKNLKSLGINTTIIYGGNLPNIEDRNDIYISSVLISTPEKYIVMQNIIPSLDDEYSTIICDEGHLLDDSSRGLEYELLLSRLRANQNKKRFVFISAIIPNLESINKWLGGTADTVIKSEYRPTQLDFAFLQEVSKSSYNLLFNPGLKTHFILNKFLDSKEINLQNGDKNYKISSKKGKTVASALKAVKQGTVMIFVPHKSGKTGVEGIVEEIIRQIEFRDYSFLLENIPNNIFDDLIEYFNRLFGEDFLLVRAVKHGILYHHGDFPQFIREIIEESVSKEYFKLIVCTNTLTEGVNLPIRTIVIYSTKRYNSETKLENINIRELRNLVGRAGRAGKETKGLIIVPHNNDFENIKRLMHEINDEKIYGNLYNIIRPITNILKKERIRLDEKLLEDFESIYPEVVESIDISLLELLSEEVSSNELMDIVMNLVSNTFSYYQSDENEKNTLSTIFIHRANKLIPYINTNNFKALRNSGISISTYTIINETIDFEDRIWFSDFDVLFEDWLLFIFDNGIFTLEIIKQNIEEYNTRNKTNVSLKEVKEIVISWMKGAWFSDLAVTFNISINSVLNFIYNILQFKLQSILSSIIRIAEIKNENQQISPVILNWPKMIQYGLDSQLKLDLFELGLTDRMAILFISDYLISRGYKHNSKNELKQYINKINQSIQRISPLPIPSIAFNSLINFMDNIVDIV